MASIAGMSLTTPARAFSAKASDSPKLQTIKVPHLSNPWRRSSSSAHYFLQGRRTSCVRPVSAAPDGLSEKVAESIKSAEQACSDDPASGECVAAWDEVEELSAAASHARDRQKDSDPLETFCKDNPETDECRTYDN